MKKQDDEINFNRLSAWFDMLIKDHGFLRLCYNNFHKVNNNIYRIHELKDEKLGDFGILRECVVLDNVSLYYNPRKKLKKPIEAGRTVANSGYGKTTNPEWVDDSAYILHFKDKYVKLVMTHKKMIDLNLVKEASYKSFRKKNKINLKSEEDLIKLTHFLNKEI